MPRRRRCQLRGRAGRGVRPGRRIRLRQVDHRAAAPRLSPAGDADGRRRGPLRGPATCLRSTGRSSIGCAATASPSCRRIRRRRSIPASGSASRSTRSCWRMAAAIRTSAPSGRCELFGLVGLPATIRVPAPLSAPALRRPAAARLHRHGARLRSGLRRAGRADHRPRRHHAGADHRAADRSARRGSACRCSMSPTISACCRRSPIGSASCMPGGWSRSRRPARSLLPIRSIPTRAA